LLRVVRRAKFAEGYIKSGREMINEGIVRREKILMSRDLEWREQKKIKNLPFSELTQVEERKSGSFQPWLTLPGLLLFLSF